MNTMTDHEAFEFELIFALPDDTDEDALLDALHDGGFDDALIGTGKPGHLGISVRRSCTDPASELTRITAAALAILPGETKVLSAIHHS